MSTHILRPTAEDLLARAIDIAEPQGAQVTIDRARKVLWVNVDGICVLRVCACPLIELEVMQWRD